MRETWLARAHPSNRASSKIAAILPIAQRAGVTLALVNSTAIRAVGYDGYTLAVQFHTSDTIYDHHGVPFSVYEGLMRASSMGAYYNQHIRGKYK